MDLVIETKQEVHEIIVIHIWTGGQGGWWWETRKRQERKG